MCNVRADSDCTRATIILRRVSPLYPSTLSFVDFDPFRFVFVFGTVLRVRRSLADFPQHPARACADLLTFHTSHALLSSGWESRNLDLMSSRRWAQKGLSLEWFRVNQIRQVRQRFAEGGGANIEHLVLQRIWSYKEKILDKKRNKISDNMMRSILTQANPEWREQRSICARILDPKNQDKMTRRRAGVVHTNWDNLMFKWANSQRWWEASKDWESFDWESFVIITEELCKRCLRNEDNQTRGLAMNGGDTTQNKEEEGRRKNKMKEKREAEELGSCLV